MNRVEVCLEPPPQTRDVPFRHGFGLGVAPADGKRERETSAGSPEVEEKKRRSSYLGPWNIPALDAVALQDKTHHGSPTSSTSASVKEGSPDAEDDSSGTDQGILSDGRDDFSQCEESDGEEHLHGDEETCDDGKMGANFVPSKQRRRKKSMFSQRMQILQKLVPLRSGKTDKASVLDDTIQYLKQLKEQVELIRRTIGCSIGGPPAIMTMAQPNWQEAYLAAAPCAPQPTNVGSGRVAEFTPPWYHYLPCVASPPMFYLVPDLLQRPLAASVLPTRWPYCVPAHSTLSDQPCTVAGPAGKPCSPTTALISTFQERGQGHPCLEAPSGNNLCASPSSDFFGR